MKTQYQSRETVTCECEVNGEKVFYDGCSSNTLEKAKVFYNPDQWEYIGSGFKTWHNGLESNWHHEHHFFILKPTPNDQ